MLMQEKTDWSSAAPWIAGVLAWLVAALAVGSSAPSAPMWAIVASTFLFGVLAGGASRALASGPTPSRKGLAGRIAVAVGIGVVVGELAALLIFGRAIDRRLDERALQTADSAPAVAQAIGSLQRDREARTGLDVTVDLARERLDHALVVARCEYRPTPACPQTRITGVPGRGPEARTANQLVAGAQAELANAVAARDRLAPDLDVEVARDEEAVAGERLAVVAGARGGLSGRWAAMNTLTLADAGLLLLRALVIVFATLLYLLPLILRGWRGETTRDRDASAQAQRERAELDADTAIAVKRAEVRRTAEILWAEHQLAQTRLAIDAQTEIDREHQRRRVVEALEAPGAPVRASAERAVESGEDMYLPIAAEAEAASRGLAELPGGTVQNLPAPVDPGRQGVDRYDEPDRHRGVLPIPSIPDATKAAARWIRPLVPPFVARAIDTTAAPLRSARQVFEEVEEIAFSLKRTRKVTVNSLSADGADGQQVLPSPAPRPAREQRTGINRIASTRGGAEHPDLDPAPHAVLAGLAVGGSGRNSRLELAGQDGLHELCSTDRPRELPPGG
ncbi:DUF4407 domain-containing protein [Mycobacterium sp.]|uniref:DUF4407 domain-containing protein n=1 Tax=Mycobacterium sp. TaxID=1785 RepID=UPI003A87E9A2